MPCGDVPYVTDAPGCHVRWKMIGVRATDAAPSVVASTAAIAATAASLTATHCLAAACLRWSMRPDAPLRRDIRLLGETLGLVLVEQDGEELLESEER